MCEIARACGLAKGPHGLLIVDKSPGPTSHDLVAQARRLYRTKSVGHAGTLDPMATGVLVLLFGEACKLSGHLTAQHKRYRATVRFGVGTTSDDAQGETTEQLALDADWCTDSRLHAALELEHSRQSQVPPGVSAIRIDGKRAYRLVREGATPALAPRVVRVEELSLLKRDAFTIDIEMLVSKGYYVRSFARDIGRSLGVPAHITALRRLASGHLDLLQAHPWPLSQAVPLIDVATAATNALGVLTLTEAGAAKARMGQAITPDEFVEKLGPDNRDVRAWLTEDGKLIAIGAGTARGFRVVRGFNI